MSKTNVYDVDKSAYKAAHGRAPSGAGEWRFKLTRKSAFHGVVAVETRVESGNFSDALKSAKRYWDFIIWRNGTNEIEVLP